MKKLFGCFTILILFAAITAATLLWKVFLTPNTSSQKRVSFNIPTGSDFEDVINILKLTGAVNDINTFTIASRMKKYDSNVKPGHYELNKGMNNRELVNMLRAGLQTPVRLVIYDIRTVEELAGLIGRKLEIDSATAIEQFRNPAFAAAYGLDTNNIISLFIRDTYEFYWNVSWEAFMERMVFWNEKFWTEERKAAAAAKKMKPHEVVTLASIVQRETLKNPEMPTIAGVYINRLRIGMPLQADPTLVFATRDFSTHRVLNYHKQIESPYNTYLYAGLPPGPICIPSQRAIDAVLYADNHQYLFFCANPDMSGYSIFSKNYEDHNKVARLYRQKLDALGIK